MKYDDRLVMGWSTEGYFRVTIGLLQEEKKKD